MNITYRQVGDYKIPNLTLPTEAKEIRLGKWGRAHGLYLQKNKQVLFTQTSSKTVLLFPLSFQCIYSTKQMSASLLKLQTK